MPSNISGISFLGAGTILVTKQNQVKGLTTAAGLWAGACLGLALGAGFYSGAIVGFFTLWCAMRILHSVDKLLSRTVKVFSIYVEFAGIRELSKFLSYGREVSCIIGGAGTARETLHKLKEYSLVSDAVTPGTVQFYNSAEDQKMIGLSKYLLEQRQM